MSKSKYDPPQNPYDPTTRALAHNAFQRGCTDRRLHRGMRLNPIASPSAKQAYLHGYRGDRFRRFPSGQLVWSSGSAR